MKNLNLTLCALALSASSQSAHAAANYDVDATLFFSGIPGIAQEFLGEGVTLFEPVVTTQGNGTGTAVLDVGVLAPDEGPVSKLLLAADGSAGPAPLPPLSSTDVSGEFIVATVPGPDLPVATTVDFSFDVTLGILVSDPTFSSASAGYALDVFADDLLISSVQGLIDESDLIAGSASLTPERFSFSFDLASTDVAFYTVQYSVFGDAVSVAVPEPNVAWLAATGLLLLGARRRLHR